jgi:hypothetical protein
MAAALVTPPGDMTEHWHTPAAYTPTMAKKRRHERDIVQDLQEDAKWSSFTNTFTRKRMLGRGSFPGDPGLRTYMLAAVLIVGAVVATVGVIALVSNLG